MKTREVVVFIIGMSAVAGTLAQERERSIPTLGQVYEITLQTYPTLWAASFYPNGAAMLDFGGAGGFNPQAAAPKGSFSFKEVYDLLVPRMNPNPSERRLPNENLTEDQLMQILNSSRDMVVRLIGTSPETSCVGYIAHTEENDKAVRTLMFRLRDKVLPIKNGVSDKEKFEGILAKFPFLAVDQPIPFTYTKYNEKAAQSAWEDVGEWPRKASEVHLKRREEQKQEMSEREQPAVGKKAPQPDATPKATPVKTTVAEEDEGEAQEASAPSSLWLYAVILSALCAGVALWLIHRKTR